MAHRPPNAPSAPPPVRPADNIPTVMGTVNLPSSALGLQPSMFRQPYPHGSVAWIPQQPQQQQQQQPMTSQGYGVPGVGPPVSPQQPVTAQQQQMLVAGAKDRNYLQQQQKLRAMASSFKKPGPLSADSLIEDLLQQKETFSRRVPQFPPATAAVPAQTAAAAGKSHGTEAQLLAGPSLISAEQSYSSLPGPSIAAPSLPGTSPAQLPLWLAPEACDLLPAVYKRVWELTRVAGAEGRDLVDTARIFSILLTSGLPRDALGYIWNLANTQIPGVLTRPELNVALALVALAQSGWRNFTSCSVLAMTPQPPVPNLQLETPAPPTVQTTTTLPPLAVQASLGSMAPQPLLPLDTPDPRSAVPKIAPSLLPMGVPPQPILNPQEPKISSSKVESSLMDDNDDDFADFQSAAPSMVSQLAQPELAKSSFLSPRDSPLGFSSFESPPASPVLAKPKGSREVGSRLANYSFGAPSSSTPSVSSSTDARDDSITDSPIKTDDSVFPKCSIKPPPLSSAPSLKESVIRSEVSEPVVAAVQSSEDKYSALRNLDLDDDLFSSEPPAAQKIESVDDFGDFLSADDSFAELSKREKPSTPTEPILPSAGVTNTAPEEWSAEFEAVSSSSNAQFEAVSSSINSQWLEPSVSVVPPSETSTASPEEEEEEDFGEFVGPSAVSSTLPQLSRLREASTKTPDSQSVASLELGGFDSLSLGGAGPASSPEGGLAELRGALEGVQWEAAALQEEGREWRQCLQSCLALLQAASRILAAIEDPHVVEEVVSSKEGEDYLANLLEVYCVTQRIGAASHQLVPACRQTLEPLLAEVERTWLVLTPFLERTSIEVHKDRQWQVCLDNPSISCALCLVHVEDTAGNSGVVHAGQRTYHASCANLWVNCVDAALPAISVP